MSDAKSGRISDIVVMVEKLITSSMDGTLFIFKSKPGEPIINYKSENYELSGAWLI